MRRLWQLTKTRWLRWRRYRKDKKALEDRGILLLSHRLLTYRTAAKEKYHQGVSHDSKKEIVYYAGQVRLCDWLFNGADPTLHPALKDAEN